jgi:phage protein U
MRLDEEAQQTEERIRNRPRKIQDVPTLKGILLEAMRGFEESLKALSPEEREAALSLYLDKIRGITYGFHVAVLKRTAKSEFRKNPNPTREAMQEIIRDSAEKMACIARLYRFL